MNIAVIGLGYVGTVTASCLASEGHSVVGVDLDQKKVDAINNKNPHFSEPGLRELVADVVESQNLRCTTDLASAFGESEVVIVCVGTPTSKAGSLDLTYLMSVAQQLGEQYRKGPGPHTIVISSTVTPGATEGSFRQVLQESSDTEIDLLVNLVFAPEFLREGSAIHDFREPEIVILGAKNRESIERISLIYAKHVQVTFTTTETAETIKAVSNTWHALKVAFANEVGRLSSAIGIDSQEVMRIFSLDKKLNISERYLRPGFAFGGSCLPKDVAALAQASSSLGVAAPIFASINESNVAHIDFSMHAISELQPKRVLILGLAFKKDTDDMRESPALQLVSKLTSTGVYVEVFDPILTEGGVSDTTRKVLEAHSKPSFLTYKTAQIDTDIETFDVIVIAQANPIFGFQLAKLGISTLVLDLTGSAREFKPELNYRGLTW